MGGGDILKKVLMVLCTLLILTACTHKKTDNYAYTLKGESEHWESEYFVEGRDVWKEKNNRTTFSSDNNHTFTMKYKGPLEELSTLRNLEYAYEAGGISGGGSEEFDEPPISKVLVSHRGGGGGARVREDGVVHVTIKWDTFEESIELRNSRK